MTVQTQLTVLMRLKLLMRLTLLVVDGAAAFDAADG
jgi:hypothetical protein